MVWLLDTSTKLVGLNKIYFLSSEIELMQFELHSSILSTRPFSINIICRSWSPRSVRRPLLMTCALSIGATRSRQLMMKKRDRWCKDGHRRRANWHSARRQRRRYVYLSTPWIGTMYLTLDLAHLSCKWQIGGVFNGEIGLKLRSETRGYARTIVLH